MSSHDVPAPRPQLIRDFLELLYPDTTGDGLCLSDERQLAIWDPSGGTTWIGSDPSPTDPPADRPENIIAARSINGEAYYHVCLHSPRLIKQARPEANLRRIRGTATSATSAPGLWADIDYQTGDHKRTGLAPDIEAVTKIALSLPLPPTLLVYTGGGVHAYWLFLDPMDLSDEDARQDVYVANMRLQAALRDKAAALGYEGVDATHDLARVLRVPGTVNHKYGVVVEMRTSTPEPRYTLDQLLEILPHVDRAAAGSGQLQFDSGQRRIERAEEIKLSVRADAKPPARLLEMIAMELVDATFLATWRRQRKVYSGRGPKGSKQDMLHDSSASSYTLALAVRMLGLGEWTDQELADTIIAWRAKHGELLKGGRALSDAELDRRVSLTIAKARELVGAATPIAVVENPPDRNSLDEDPVALAAVDDLRARVSAREDTEPVEPVSSTVRDELLAKISNAIGVRVLRVEREVEKQENGGVYTLVLPGVNGSSEQFVRIGTANALLNPAIVRGVVLDACGVLLRKMKSQAWDPVAQTIREVAVEPPDSETVRHSLREMLREYIARTLEGTADAAIGGESPRRPFVLPHGRVAIRSSHLAEWVAMRPGGQVCTGRAWARSLRMAGLGATAVVRRAGLIERRFVTSETAAQLALEACNDDGQEAENGDENR